MIWTVFGALAVLYESWAVRFERTTISEAAHHWPWALFVAGWQASLAVHFYREWRKCEKREGHLA